jgi:hypothetical protein
MKIYQILSAGRVIANVEAQKQAKALEIAQRLYDRTVTVKFLRVK